MTQLALRKHVKISAASQLTPSPRSIFTSGASFGTSPARHVLGSSQMSPCPLFTPVSVLQLPWNRRMRLGSRCNPCRQKVKKAQQLWNTRNPEKIALLYTEGTHVASTQLVELMIAIGLSDSIWRNRDQFLKGHEEIIRFLTKKWCVHLHLAFDCRVSVCF